eukprot:gene11798-15786_t
MRGLLYLLVVLGTTCLKFASSSSTCSGKLDLTRLIKARQLLTDRQTKRASQELYCLCYYSHHSWINGHENSSIALQDENFPSHLIPILYETSILLTELQNFEMALICIESYLRKTNNNLIGKLQLGLIHAETGNVSIALNIVYEVLKSNEINKEVYATASELLQKISKVMSSTEINPNNNSISINNKCNNSHNNKYNNKQSNQSLINTKQNLFHGYPHIISLLNINNIRDEKKLKELAINQSIIYKNAQPFPHIIMDNFFSGAFLKRFVNENGFASLNTISFFAHNFTGDGTIAHNVQNLKIGCRDSAYTNIQKYLFSFFSSKLFIEFLQLLTGINNLIPDPHLYGGGTHEILSGGYLKIHADFNNHVHYKIWRRVNVFVYLNDNWNEEWGGHLELWNSDVTIMVKKIAPLFNRFVAFSSSDTSYHGHPDPLRTPLNISRKSIAMYYYTVLNENGVYAHMDTSSRWYTDFQNRPGEVFVDDSLPPGIKK